MQNRYIILHLLLLLLLIVALFRFPFESVAGTDTQFDITSQDIQINLSKKVEVEDLPMRIVINSADINMNVVLGELDGETWKVDETNANYAQGSSYLDEKYGNTIIYAHARYGMFITLNQVNIGDKISVFSNDKLYEYEILSKQLILPNEIDLIKSKGNHNLTLFTCEGIDDKYRLLVKATRVNTMELPEEVI